jgi:hypothetical protein
MNGRESKDCCTSEQALQYCIKLWEQYDELDEEKLTLIQRQTINRSEATIEDVLRGFLRSRLRALRSGVAGPTNGNDTVKELGPGLGF